MLLRCSESLGCGRGCKAVRLINLWCKDLTTEASHELHDKVVFGYLVMKRSRVSKPVLEVCLLRDREGLFRWMITCWTSTTFNSTIFLFYLKGGCESTRHFYIYSFQDKVQLKQKGILLESFTFIFIHLAFGRRFS